MIACITPLCTLTFQIKSEAKAEQVSELTNLHEVLYDVLIPGAADGELCEPDLPAVPLVELLQPVHHLVGVTNVVVCGQVVNPAPQGFTRLEHIRGITGIISFRKEFSTSKNGSNQLVLPPAGAGLTRI